LFSVPISTPLYVQFRLVYLHAGDARRYGNLAFDLVGSGIEHGVPVLDASDSRHDTGVVEHRLGQRRLPTGLMADEGDVPYPVDGVLLQHNLL